MRSLADNRPSRHSCVDIHRNSSQGITALRKSSFDSESSAGGEERPAKKFYARFHLQMRELRRRGPCGPFGYKMFIREVNAINPFVAIAPSTLNPASPAKIEFV